MLLRVLGTAAGGGLPQWNCACPGCAGARAHPTWRRRHASLAVRAAEGRWYIVNATPDIADQIEACPDLHPGPEPRHTPLAGVVLTDAELDHTLGIARLREADRIEVLATGPVRRALCDRAHLDEILRPYAPIEWRELKDAAIPLTGETEGAAASGGADVEIAAIPVSVKRPRYAAEADPAATADTAPWVVALHLRDRRTGRSAVYAPALAAWPDRLQEAVSGADCVIVDGTFWDDDEPRRTGISSRSATGMGHLPIDGPDGTARLLAPLAGTARCFYTHLNNTNPLVDPGAPQHKLLAERGIAVAAEGMEIAL